MDTKILIGLDFFVIGWLCITIGLWSPTSLGSKIISSVFCTFNNKWHQQAEPTHPCGTPILTTDPSSSVCSKWVMSLLNEVIAVESRAKITVLPTWLNVFPVTTAQSLKALNTKLKTNLFAKWNAAFKTMLSLSCQNIWTSLTEHQLKPSCWI